MAQIGQIINAKFRISRLIGRGGMSRIYLAEDLRLHMPWAVKEIPKTFQGRDNSLYIQSALREAEMIKSLDHPAIVRIVDIAEDEQSLYIIEDHISGTSLKELAEGSAGIREAQLLGWALQICDILQYLHSREPAVIYRDLKPENLILSESGHIKLIDFGIARHYDPDKERDTEYLGTRWYAAPEQYEEHGRQTDARTDIYCLGMTLKELSGCLRQVSPHLAAVIRKCTRPDPDERFQSVKELQRSLQKPARRGRKTGIAARTYLPRLLLCLAAAAVIITGILLYYEKRPGGRAGCAEVLETVSALEYEGGFGKEEEEELLNMILPCLSELQKEEGFEELAFQIGLLYWYYYDYGSDHLAGMDASLSWFRMAAGSRPMAEAYETVGMFLTEQSRMDPDRPEQGACRTCFDQLNILIEGITQGDYPSRMVLETYRLAKRILNSWQEEFLADGVSEASFRALSRLVS